MYLGRDNYNTYLRNEFPKYLEKVYNYILNLDGGSVKSVTVDEDKRPLSYYVDHGLTCNFIFKVNYSTKKSANNTLEITVPKLVTSVFVVNGGVRVPVFHLVSDYNIRSYANVFVFDNNRKFSYPDQEFIYKDPDSWDFTNVHIDDVPRVDKKYLELDELQSTKLAIKLGEKTPPNNYTITPDLLHKINNKLSGYMDQFEDFILDKKVMAPHLSLIDHISNNMGEIRTSMRGKLFRYGKIYSKDLQNKINSFFSMRSDSFLSVQNPAKNNVLNFSSVSSKIVIDKDRTFYNESFTDLIDPIRTPENVSGVNKNNELNVCTVVEEDGTFSIKVYDLNFNKVKIPYYKYYDSDIILEDSVDYYSHKINPEVNVKYRGGIRKVKLKELTGEVFIDAMPDDKLSVSTRNIPMVNHADSVRSGMGSSMVNQAIELLNPEEPVVTPSNSDGIDSPMNVYSEVDGIVEKIDDGIITVRDSSGKEVVYESPPIQSSNMLNITSIPNVKVGDKVKKNDLIVKPRIVSDSGNMMLGANCKIAFMAYGNTFEDGVIISSGIKDKFTHVSILDLVQFITEEEDLQWIKDIGSEVTNKEVLVSASRDLSKVSDRFKTLSKVVSDKKFNASLTVPVDTVIGGGTAYVTDVSIQKGSGLLKNEEGYISGYLAKYDNNRRKVKDKIDPHYASMKINLEPERDISEFKYKIVVRLAIVKPLKVGDKLTSRYGGKGLVAEELPPEKMPKDENGVPVDMIMNPYAVSARKIPALLMEVYLGNIAEKLYPYVDSIIDKDIKKVREVLTEISNPNLIRYTDEEIRDYHEKYRSQGRYPIVTNSYAKDIPNKINRYYELLGISNEGEVLYDGYTKRKILTPIITGNLYLMKLRHLPEFSMKVTSDAMAGDRPVLGGKFRKGGQKLGEMEVWSLFANNMDQYLFTSRSQSSDYDKYTMLSNLLIMGYDLNDEKGNSLSQKKFSDNIAKLKNKYN